MFSKGIAFSLTLALGAGALGLSGCGGSGDSARVAQTVDASKNGVVSVALADNDGSVHVSGNFQFNLIGTDKDGKQTNLNEQATWSLSDSRLGSIKNGLFTAAGQLGPLTLNVAYAGLTDSQPINLTDANLDSITVEHASGSVDVCKNTQFTAKALFSDGHYYNYPLTWALSDSDSRELANFADETKPELSTKKSGAVKVIARGTDNEGKTVTSPEYILSIDATLIDLVLTSDKSTEMNQGQTATAKATAEYRDGSKVAITPNASLKSSNENAMTVNATTGLITAVAGTIRGTEVDLTAICDDTTETLPLKIFKPDIRTMEIVGPNSLTATESLQVLVGSQINPRIKVNYEGTVLDPEIYEGTDVAWIIDDELSPDYDQSLIKIDGASGLITVDDSMTLTLDLILTVQARITKVGGGTEVGSDGNELKDTIKVTIKPK